MEKYSVYKPLFMDALNDESVGFCTWIRDGDTIDTAIPDLREMTDDKREWSAVVVLSEDDIKELGSVPNTQNPFDFSQFGQTENELESSDNDLIRLTHMLGNIPIPEKQFVSKTVEEEGKSPYIVYELVDDSEANAAYHDLQQQFSFDGVSPTNIYLITLREPWIDKSNISHNWSKWFESMSSEFWKRNRYPSNCRFMVFDTIKQGPIRREEDLFRYWLTIRLLTTGNIDAASFQAYRLYRGDIIIDKSAMEEVFQTTVNRLSSAKLSLKRYINNEMYGLNIKKTSLPDFRIEIPMLFELPENTLREVKKKLFAFLTRGRGGDIVNWDEARETTDNSFITSIRAADRELDQTANRMKSSYTYRKEDIERLDKYQREDLEIETDKLYEDIIELQGELPNEKMKLGTDAGHAADSARSYLRQRVTTRQAFVTLAVSFVIILMSWLPAIVHLIKGDRVSLPTIVIGISALMVSVILCGTATLLFQKLKLNRLINAFNLNMRIAFSSIQSNAENYSDYLNAIASHSRGLSYLELSKQKDGEISSFQGMHFKHIDAIEILLSRLKTWSKAFHLNVEFDEPLIYENAQVDVMTPPTDNLLYSLETNQNHEIEINTSGMFINSPFSFIERIELIREEIYEDGDR